MGDTTGPKGQDSLSRAEETIARQAAEIERLRRRLDVESFAQELREVLSLAAAAGTIAAPVTHFRLLQMIVETAADVIKADAASLFLVDEEAGELVFEVALGQKAEEVKKFRVPLGHGVAGLVALSGQPMAISNAASDPRQASDIARSVGYVPQNLLCVPLFHDEQVIGVLELLNKRGAPSFSPSDMDTLGLFANQAAVAIQQSRTNRSLSGLLYEVVASLSSIPDERRQSLLVQARAFGIEADQDVTYRRTLDLARLVQELARQGEAESAACETILKGFASYLRAASHPSGNGEVVR